MAWHSRDYAGIASLAETLRNSRAVIREMALEAGAVSVINRIAQLQETPQSGCVLVTPPLVGAEGRGYRDDAWTRQIAVLLVTREPRTKAGLWPVVAVGEGSHRGYVQPPPGVREVPATVCRDEMSSLPEPDWFLSASKAIGEAVLKKTAELEHPSWRVEDLLNAVLAHPDDEAIHDALAEAALEAARTEEPEGTRPDSSDPFCF